MPSVASRRSTPATRPARRPAPRQPPPAPVSGTPATTRTRRRRHRSASTPPGHRRARRQRPMTRPRRGGRALDIDAHDDASVDLAGRTDSLHHGRQPVGRDGRGEVDRVSSRRRRRHQAADLSWSRGDSTGTSRPPASAASDAQDQRPSGVADQCDPTPGRSAADDRAAARRRSVPPVCRRAAPRCGQATRPRRPGRRRPQPCVTPRHASPAALRPLLRATTGLRCDTGAGYPSEADGVTERLEIQQNDVRLLVVGPQPQQVVAADVDLVAHRHKRRNARHGNAEPRPAMAIPTPPDCEAIAMPPPGTNSWPVNVVLSPQEVDTTPRQFGPTTRMPWPRAAASTWSCMPAPSSQSSANPAETDDRARHADHAAPANHVRDQPCRHRDDRQIWHLVQLIERGDGVDPTDHVGRGAHDADPPAEGLAQMGDDPPARRTLVTIDADHYDVQRRDD